MPPSNASAPFWQRLLRSLPWSRTTPDGRPRPRISRCSAREAFERVQSGQALLIDVRNPGEWAQGVAQPAMLLSLGSFHESHPDFQALTRRLESGIEAILYCHSGVRSHAAARRLTRLGLPAANLGGYSAWVSAGLPTRRPTKSKTRH